MCGGDFFKFRETKPEKALGAGNKGVRRHRSEISNGGFGQRARRGEVVDGAAQRDELQQLLVGVAVEIAQKFAYFLVGGVLKQGALQEKWMA